MDDESGESEEDVNVRDAGKGESETDRTEVGGEKQGARSV